MKHLSQIIVVTLAAWIGFAVGFKSGGRVASQPAIDPAAQGRWFKVEYVGDSMTIYDYATSNACIMPSNSLNYALAIASKETLRTNYNNFIRTNSEFYKAVAEYIKREGDSNYYAHSNELRLEW